MEKLDELFGQPNISVSLMDLNRVISKHLELIALVFGGGLVVQGTFFFFFGKELKRMGFKR